MAEDVAVPDVLPAEVVEAVGDAAGEGGGRHVGLPGDRVDVAEAHGRTDRDRRVKRPHAVGDAEGQRRRHRAHGDHGVHQRADAHGVLEAEFVVERQHDLVVPAEAADHLHVEDVEVDRVGVDAVVGDVPDLRAVVEHGRGVTSIVGVVELTTFSVGTSEKPYRLRLALLVCGGESSIARLPLMRPYSGSKAAPISSWIPLGCRGMVTSSPSTVRKRRKRSVMALRMPLSG